MCVVGVGESPLLCFEGTVEPPENYTTAVGGSFEFWAWPKTPGLKNTPLTSEALYERNQYRRRPARV